MTERENLGIFLHLGCEHYLSGDHFDCAYKCPRTEKGTEQVHAKIKIVKEHISQLEKELRQERKILFRCQKLLGEQ